MVEPESEDMNTRVRMWIGTEGRKGDGGGPFGDFGMRDSTGGRGGGPERERSEEAVRRGPIVLVVRWWWNACCDL